MFRRLTPSQLAVDVGLAVACLLLRWTMAEFLPIWFVVLSMATALALRRVSPPLALGIAWLGAIAQMIAQRPPDVANIAILAVLFTTARYGERAVRWVGLASAVVGAVVASAYLILVPSYGRGVGGGNFLFVGDTPGPRLWLAVIVGFGGALAVLGLSWTLGLLVRIWANARESRRARAQAEGVVVVEQERNRIARDMHDVVAHSLAVVIAQADGARYASGIAAKNDALGTISGTAREALGDVRLLLGQLRHSQEAGPQPALADLDQLFDQLRASGLDIEVQVHAEQLALPAAQQLALYRIVQEALTNALRHGDVSKQVTVDLEWSPDAADATITNTRAVASGAAPASAPAVAHALGHGIAGMRERALLVSGTLTAETEGDTFVVRAHIPAPPIADGPSAAGAAA
ncbi:MAG: histidine kinase [Rhodoglobus sp.]